ncbi:MAG: GNAT family N-acetyltransferase [Aeromonadaceae bacterium]|nr:GNAT family N-acetyltransferase [Aeromonadaceae bacterium]
MSLSLRPATPADLPFLLALRRQTMTPYLQAAGMPCDEASHLARIQYHFEAARIVHWQGQPVGLFKAVWLAERQYWYLIQIQLAPQAQGRGLGARLIGDLLNQAAGQRVVLSVIHSNPARHLYQRLGFVPFAEDDKELWLEKPPTANKS